MPQDWQKLIRRNKRYLKANLMILKGHEKKKQNKKIINKTKQNKKQNKLTNKQTKKLF